MALLGGMFLLGRREAVAVRSQSVRLAAPTQEQAADIPTSHPQSSVIDSGDLATVSGLAQIIDGDTIEIEGVRVRLFGVDAPESNQPCVFGEAIVACGEIATAELRNIVGNREVSCSARDTDRYGRIVAVCSVAGQDIGAQLVTAGWALAYTRYSQNYVAQEQAAKAARIGLWSGQFENPENWRHRN